MMLRFYKKAISIFFALFALTIVLAVVCLNRVFISTTLFPARNSTIPWQFESITDVQKGGTSSIVVNESNSSLDYDYVLVEDVQYPHVTAVVAFDELANAQRLADLSRYSRVRFRVKCTPHNNLAFHLHSHDPEVTDRENFSSYRIAETVFSCHNEWSKVDVDLKHLNVAAWWLETFSQVLSDERYWLDKVVAFSFGASRHGPVQTKANVKIADLTLVGVDWRYIWGFAVGFIVLWLGYGVWLFKQYTQSLITELREKLRKDRPLMAYQQLSIKPHKDKEKSDILRFMATEYANPDLSLDVAITQLGVNRTKINEILKEELGFTFNAYLNKLRLAEAARLLSEKGEVNVAEIAYAVGYNNVSYFNKLFKNEYGCTPKTFKGMYQSNRLE